MPSAEVGRSEELLDELAAWVRLETPTTDAAAVNRLMDVAARDLAGVGADLTRVPGRDGFGDSLIARTPGEGKPILVAGHLDTVWARGTLEAMPYAVDGEKAHGPGIYDMKAGSFLAFHAVRVHPAPPHADAPPDHPAAHPRRGGRQPHQPRPDRGARPRTFRPGR